jgi:hypothetical protein
MVMAEEIQPGWQVVDSFGEEIGTVSNATGPNFRVKLYGDGEIEVPNEACSLVETGRVELARSKKELQSGGVVSQ